MNYLYQCICSVETRMVSLYSKLRKYINFFEKKNGVPQTGYVFSCGVWRTVYDSF